jgi:hypothetical protein
MASFSPVVVNAGGGPASLGPNIGGLAGIVGVLVALLKS